MSRIVACPFCRELFKSDEAKMCPECDVDLQPLEKLPPSLDVIAEQAEEGELLHPVDRPMPLTDFSRARGALLLLAVAGLALFFGPWVEMTKPNLATFSGYDLASGRAGWLWGGAVAWFVMIPLVLSRRTIAKMRGVRIITGMFALMTLGEVVMLLSLPPQGHRLIPVEFAWGWALYGSAIVSVLGVFFAWRFGGSVDELRATPWEDAQGNLHVERSDGQVLH